MIHVKNMYCVNLKNKKSKQEMEEFEILSRVFQSALQRVGTGGGECGVVSDLLIQVASLR